MMRQFAIPKETRKHRQRVIGDGLIDERFLPLKGLNGTARWKVVRIVEKRRDDLREQFRNGGKPATRLAIAIVFGLPEHKLPAIRGIAQVQPIDALVEEWRLCNLEPCGARVHTRNNDVHLTLSFRGYVLCRGAPVQSPKQVQPIDEHDRLVQPDLRFREGLPHAVRRSHLIAVSDDDVKPRIPSG